mmetsp:Transcript_3040/g.4595  ORF Transcript_3040/g.4595 Transcript_3040/m.4595 type:complete len:139 (+) Transcript_3040:195-611(+)
MQRNYLTIKQFLESEFPELRGHISGGNYPPPDYAIYLMQLISAVHMVAIAFIFMGDKLWDYVPMVNGPPEWYKACKQYPMQTFIFLFFVFPTVLQSKITTGAFEITLDGEILFSKIATGRFPDGPGLMQMFQKAGFGK